MAISKSLRFAILRRDGFACRYCGASANESGEGLTIDHVVPVAHGGDDDPTNLVAACHDCNAGKAATPETVPAPDEARLAQLREQVSALRERVSIESEIQRLNYERWMLWQDDVVAVQSAWEDAFRENVPLPSDDFLLRHLTAGITSDTLTANIERAAFKAGHGISGARYFYGCCRNQLEAVNA